MSDASEWEDEQYKCLVIANQSDADITLYIYDGWTPLRWVSTLSKIIKPNQGCFYHQETPFMFEIVAKPLDDKKTKNLLEPMKCTENKVITITKLLECQLENLARIENGKQICVRKIHREEELAPADLYDILGLDMEEVRKMRNEDATKVIRKAYKKQALIWHPDKNYGNSEMLMQITRAKEILMDGEKRARYHNEVDYDKGWFSGKRWKACFWSECYTEKKKEETPNQNNPNKIKPNEEEQKEKEQKGKEQKQKEQKKEEPKKKPQKTAFRHRMVMFSASLLFVTGGIALTLGTAGAAAPVVVICGGIFGGGLTGAGFLSMGHTMSKKSVLDGCDGKSWALKAGIGFLGGALTGGAAVGITAGMVGIGSAALESSAVTAGQYVGMGSATGAVGGVVSSLSSDLAKVVVDKEKITAKQVVSRAICGGVVGMGAGAVAGLVTKGIVDSRASAATSTLEGDAVEQVAALTGGKRIGHAVAHAVSKQVTIAGAKAALGITSNVVDERLNDSVENQKITKHVQNGLENIPANALQSAALYTAGGFIGHGFEELTLNTATSNKPQAGSYPNSDETDGNIQGLGNETNEGAGEENGEPSNETNDEQEDDETEENMVSKQLFSTEKTGMNKRFFKLVNQSKNANMNKSECGRSHATIETTAPEPDDQNYEGHCRSTHVVSEESRANQSSNGESYKENPKRSEEINEKQKADEQSDEKQKADEQIDEEPPKVTIKYKSEGAWISKMIVKGNDKGKKFKEEVSGDGKRVHISEEAKNIEVRFQVQRPLWGDIKKYDRFKKTWCEPDTPHVFRYEKAVDRTFTLSGPLWWEAVMRVSDEHHDETKEMS